MVWGGPELCVFISAARVRQAVFGQMSRDLFFFMCMLGHENLLLLVKAFGSLLTSECL